MTSGDDGQAITTVVGEPAGGLEALLGQRKSDYIPPVPSAEKRRVPIKGYDPDRGYPWPSIMPQLSEVDARNLIKIIKLQETSGHEFNYMQPNAVRYFAEHSEDQNKVASAYITLLEEHGVYGIHRDGKHPRYTISYDEDTRSLIFLATDSETAEIMAQVARQVQALVGGKEDTKISLQSAATIHYGSRVAADMVDFKKPDQPVAYEKVSGLIPAIVVRLKALGIAPNEETTEGKSTLDKVQNKVEEWNVGGAKTEEAGAAIFKQHWAELLAMIAHVPQGPGGAAVRDSRTKELHKAGYGDEAAKLISQGFPKPTFDRLVKEVGASMSVPHETRSAHALGKINAQCIGEVIAPLIREALDTGVFLTAESIINHGANADATRKSLDMEALDAAIDAAVSRTKSLAKARNT